MLPFLFENKEGLMSLISIVAILLFIWGLVQIFSEEFRVFTVILFTTTFSLICGLIALHGLEPTLVSPKSGEKFHYTLDNKPVQHIPKFDGVEEALRHFQSLNLPEGLAEFNTMVRLSKSTPFTTFVISWKGNSFKLSTPGSNLILSTSLPPLEVEKTSTSL